MLIIRIYNIFIIYIAYNIQNICIILVGIVYLLDQRDMELPHDDRAKRISGDNTDVKGSVLLLGLLIIRPILAMDYEIIAYIRNTHHLIPLIYNFLLIVFYHFSWHIAFQLEQQFLKYYILFYHSNIANYIGFF